MSQTANNLPEMRIRRRMLGIGVAERRCDGFDEFGSISLINAVSRDAAPIFQIMKILRMLAFLLANKYVLPKIQNGHLNSVRTTNKNGCDITNKKIYIHQKNTSLYAFLSTNKTGLRRSPS